MTQLSGKHVVITGANGAVGRATAAQCLQQGAHVFLTDVTPVEADALASLYPSASAGQYHFHRADVTDAAAVRDAFAAAMATFGPVDAAVLAAGIEGMPGALEDIPGEQLDAVLDVNIKGSFYWLQHCLRHMKARRSGSIVALASISASLGSALLAPYAISKHAVLGMVRSAALEAAPHGVRINAVSPGPIDSDMMRRIDTGLRELQPARVSAAGNAAAGIPAQRYASADEVAAMILFLCSDASRYCNGANYMVDGGFSVK
ncbi:MAG: SDR family NAD(P)-dependent oxidoreductase [Rhodocyclaceae bacterium]